MRDTWHPSIGPRVLFSFTSNTTRVNIPLVHVNQWKCANEQPTDMCHIIMMVWPSTWPYGLYGQVQPASQIFSCLAWWTDRDNSFIRTPFAKVNIPPESGRRDGRNGIGFIAFRALSFLSIFQACFWIRFRITCTQHVHQPKALINFIIQIWFLAL